MNTLKGISAPHARVTQAAAFLMPLIYFLPFVARAKEGQEQVYTGFGLISAQPVMLSLVLMFGFSCLAFLLGMALLIRIKKGLLYALTAVFSGAIIAGIYALLSFKQTADASGFLSSFMVRDFGFAFWLSLLVPLCGLIAALLASRKPASYVVLSAMAVVWLLPIVWLVLTAFRAEPGAYTAYILPRGYTLDNFRRLFTQTSQFNFPRWYMNTLVVAVFTCLITSMLVLMISYTFSRLRFPSRKLFMNIGLIISMFPGFMSMIAVYHILKAVGLAKSLISLILVYSGGGSLGYFIAKGFFDTIPRSLDEAATIDGASKNMIFWKIILPSSTPIVVYTAITAFIAPWVDFIFVSVIMKDDYQNYTIALGLFKMLEREHIYTYFTRFCAGAVLVAIPITLLFIRIQKFYVEGVTGGAVKG